MTFRATSSVQKLPHNTNTLHAPAQQRWHVRKATGKVRAIKQQALTLNYMETSPESFSGPTLYFHLSCCTSSNEVQLVLYKPLKHSWPPPQLEVGTMLELKYLPSHFKARSWGLHFSALRSAFPALAPAGEAERLCFPQRLSTVCCCIHYYSELAAASWGLDLQALEEMLYSTHWVPPSCCMILQLKGEA